MSYCFLYPFHFNLLSEKSLNVSSDMKRNHLFLWLLLGVSPQNSISEEMSQTVIDDIKNV